MKRSVSLLAVMVFVFAFGMAYADELQPGEGYTSDKMIRDDDILKYDHDDMERGTVNQLPALPDEVKGSAAGGSNKDTEPDAKSDTPEKLAPVEKDKTEPSDRGGMGGPDKRWDPLGY